MEHKNIFEAISAIYGEVGYVQKQSSRQLNYTYASEAGFIQALRPAFINHGVIVRVANVEILKLENYETKNGTVMMRAVIKGEVEFCHAPSTTTVTTQALGEGSDAGDKAVNKAMTDMYKYALRHMFMIETGDDPDQTQPEERMKDVAQELGGVVKKSEPAEISLEEAGAVVTEDGTPYSKLPLEELAVRFNGLQKMKKNSPEKFTEEHRKKMAAAKLLIADKSAQKEVFGE